MKYLLLLYTDKRVYEERSAEDNARLFDEYMAYSRRIHRSGNYIAGEGLEHASTAKTVRRRDGKTLTTDGPFAETRELLGGFYLVEAKDLGEAIELASGIPAARTGKIEVRPVMPTPPVG